MPTWESSVRARTLATSIHKISSPTGAISLRDLMEGLLRGSGGTLPEHIATGILALIERLSPEDVLCHGDLHAGNVIMTADGPKLIDWLGMVRAPAAFDIASCHIVHTELAPDVVDDPERPRAVNAAVQSEYARLAGISPTALTAATEPCLPVACVFALFGHAPGPALRTRLIQSVEAALRSED